MTPSTCRVVTALWLISHSTPTPDWPEFLFELAEFQYPGRLNCATELLDKPVTRGHGHRVALRTADGECTYTQLFTQSNRIANVTSMRPNAEFYALGR